MSESLTGTEEQGSSRAKRTAATRPEGDPAGVLARLVHDWPGWLAMLSAALLYLTKGFGGGLRHDPGVYLYGAEHVAKGILPYLSLLNRSGPLGQAVPGAGIWFGGLIGIHPVVAGRLTMAVASVAAVGAAYYAAKLIWSSRLAGFVAAFGLISFQGFAYYATTGPREKTLLVLFMLLTLIAMHKRSWMWAGVTIALTTLTWQPAFIFTMAGVLVAIALGVPGWPAKTRAVVRVAVGGLVTTLLVLAPYLVSGHLQAFIDCFIVIPAVYTHQAAAYQHLHGVIQTLRQGFGYSLLPIFIGFAATGVASLLALARVRRAAAAQASILGSGVVFATAFIWSVLDFQAWPDLFVLLASAAVGLGWLVSGSGAKLARPLLFTTIVVSVALGALATRYALSPNGVMSLAKQRAITGQVFGHLPADATVLSDNAPHWMAVAQKDNVTTVQTYSGTFRNFLDATYPGGYLAYQHAIESAPPTVIIHYVSKHSNEKWVQNLMAQYELVGTTRKTEWYVNKSVDAATRSEIKLGLAKWDTTSKSATAKNG